MRVVIFTHSLISDWNHGNAHFLRGIAAEFQGRGHTVDVYEPRGGWSYRNLMAERGEEAAAEFHRAFPNLESRFYELGELNLERELESADLTIAHEWNDPALIRRLGEYRAAHDGFRLLFHDTHHRSVTDPASMQRFDLRLYDGALAYGASIRDVYRAAGWARRVWVWHEAADTRVFQPRQSYGVEGDLVWVGNWGDGERTEELREFLIEPVKALRLRARVYGVRYPPEAIAELHAAGIEYGGWLPNYRVPEIFSRYRVTIHVPRRPYAAALSGIPTIRPFEALACGIPLVSAPWSDCEGLFRAGKDYLAARDGAAMRRRLREVLSDERLAKELRAHGLETIRARHTCAHRVNVLLDIHRQLEGNTAAVSLGGN